MRLSNCCFFLIFGHWWAVTKRRKEVSFSYYHQTEAFSNCPLRGAGKCFVKEKTIYNQQHWPSRTGNFVCTCVCMCDVCVWGMKLAALTRSNQLNHWWLKAGAASCRANWLTPGRLVQVQVCVHVCVHAFKLNNRPVRTTWHTLKSCYSNLHNHIRCVICFILCATAS